MIRIAGAGIIGLATAFELTERDYQVQIFDPAPLSGASRFAGGMLAPFAEVQYQQENLFPLMAKSRELYPDFLRRLQAATDLPTGYDEAGTLIVAADAADAQHIFELYQHLERITVRTARELEPALHPRLAGVGLIQQDTQLQPRLLGAALMDVLARRGVEFIAQKLPTADADIVCTGLGASDRLPLHPVYGDILRLSSPRRILQRVVRGFVQDRPIYVIPRGEHEIAVGATSREDERHQPAIDGVFQLLHDAIRVVPALEECELLEASVGARPGTPDDLPYLGRVENQIFSTGFFRHGILLAPLAADTVARLVAGDPVDPTILQHCNPRRFDATYR